MSDNGCPCNRCAARRSIETGFGASVIRRARYVCAGQIPIVVEDTGAPEGASYHGPWITYRLEGEPEGSGSKVLVTAFRELLAFGYCCNVD